MTRVALLALALTATAAADPPAPTRAERWARYKAACEATQRLFEDEQKAARTAAARTGSATLPNFSAAYATKRAELWRDVDLKSSADVLAFAEQSPADDLGCEAAAHAINGLIGQQEQLDRCRAILRRHAKNPLVHGGLYRLAVVQNPADDPFLLAVLADNPDRRCRGYTCALLGLRARLRADNPVPDAEATACREAARGWFRRAADEYGDVERERTVDRETLAVFAARGLEELDAETLVGRPAPPLKGIDLQARPFDLTDHRGKVVLVHFWSGPEGWTADLVPHLKTVAARLAGRPFAVVGVCGDGGELEVGQRKATRLGMPWPSLHAGADGTTRATANQWLVEGWPTLYLVGPDGVVRRRLVGITEPALLGKLAEAHVDRVGR